MSIVRIVVLLAIILTLAVVAFPRFGESLRLGVWAVNDDIATTTQRLDAEQRKREADAVTMRARVAARIDGSLKALFSADVRALALWNKGIVAGGLNHPGTAFARFAANGILDRGFGDHVSDELFQHGNGYVNRIVVAPDGTFALLIGSFNRRSVLKIAADGTIDEAFSAAVEKDSVTSAVVLPSGDVVLAGSRLSYWTRQNQRRGSWPDPDFELQGPSTVHMGKGGQHLFVQGTMKGPGGRFHLARLAVSGKWDESFARNARAATDGKLVVRADGGLVAVSIGERQYCAEKAPAWGDCVGSYRRASSLVVSVIDPSGVVPATLVSESCTIPERGMITDIALDKDGGLWLAGALPIAGDRLHALHTLPMPRKGPSPGGFMSGLARIDLENDALDVALARTFVFDALAPQPPAVKVLNSREPPPVRAILPMADGSLFLGGSFTRIRGEARSHIARLGADGKVQ